MLQATKEIHDKFKIKSLDSFRAQNGLVVCEVLTDNANSRTKSGIYKVSKEANRDQYLNQNANRVVRVVKLPKSLPPHRWKTNIELKVGDIAWVSPFNAVNCPMIILDDKEYSLISYYDFRVAKRRNFKREINCVVDKDGKGKRVLKGNKKYMIEDEKVHEIIPLNGYLMCEEVYTKKKALDYEKDVLTTKYGRIKYVGEPNEYYISTVGGRRLKQDLDGGCDVKSGDLVLKEERIHMRVEEPLHLHFDGKTVYFVIQRRHIMVIL